MLRLESADVILVYRCPEYFFRDFTEKKRKNKNKNKKNKWNLLPLNILIRSKKFSCVKIRGYSDIYVFIMSRWYRLEIKYVN